MAAGPVVPEQVVHPHLAVDQRLAGGGFDLLVAAVGGHLPGVDVVGQLHLEDVGQLLDQGRVLDPDAHLHPALGVAGEEIAGCDIDAGLPPVKEAVDPGVLQIAAHDAADVQVLGLAGDAGPHAADAADDHVDAGAGAAGLLQLEDDVAVADGVVFQDHGGGAAQAGGLDHPVHLVQQDALEAQGGHQHLVGLLGQLLDRQILEHAGGLLADVRVGGDEGQVGVQLAGLFVVVAGADLGDIGVALGVFPGDEGQLGVDLVVVETVDHGAAGFLQLLGPVDVVLLVKAGPQLHQGHHLFAVFGGVHQGLDDLGFPCQAVEGHLDGDDVGVAGGLFQHQDKGPDGLVGIIQQDVVLFDLLGQAVVEGRHHGPGRRIEQLGVAVLFDTAVQLVEKAQVQGALLLKDPAVVQLQPGAEHLDDLGRGAGGDLQADGRQLAAALEQLGHDLTVVDVVVHHALFDVDVGVAGHPEQAFLHDALLGKDHADVVIDQLLGEGEQGLAVPLEEAQPLHLAGDGDDAQAHLPHLFVLEQDAEVDLLVAQEREGMAVVHDLGAEDGEQLVLEVFFPEAFLLLVDLVKVDLVVAVLVQRLQGLVVIFVAVHLQLGRLGHDGVQLLFGGHVGLVFRLFLFALEVGPLLQGAHPHHEKLVQVGAVNGQKFELLGQGDILVLAQHQDPLVEIQPAQLPVDKNAVFLHRSSFPFRPGAAHIGEPRPVPDGVLGNSAYPRYVLDPLVGAVGGTVLQDGPGPFFAHAGQGAQGVQPGGVQVHLRLLPKGAGGSPALRALRRAQGRRIPHSQQDKQRRCRSGRRQKAQLPPVEILPYHCTVSSPKKKALRTGCGELFTGILPIYMVCTALPLLKWTELFWLFQQLMAQCLKQESTSCSLVRLAFHTSLYL